MKRIVLLVTMFLSFLSLPSFAAKPTEIVIDSVVNGPFINRNIYSQFTEHLGRGIYEGIYVGKGSKIENTNGFRKDVIAALKALQVPLVRWPGGCFADEYNWRDGIGPQSKRPIKVNTHWGGVEEDNSFGTHEFFEFIDLIGAQAYINGNLGSGSAREMAEWMEYMTSSSNSTLVQMRRKNGRDKPWNIAYFGIGNESWGCGGNMRPEYYADLYKQYATFLKAPHGFRPQLVASGGHSDQTIWTEVLSREIKKDMAGISFHYYTLPKGDWSDKGRAIGFPESEWASTFVNTVRMDGFIERNIAVLDKNDPDGKVGFYVDEWGTWYDPEPERDPGFLYQRNTLRDALVAGVNFNIFHKYAERVHMSIIAQMANVLQAMILTDKEKMVLTPTYYAYDLYKVFQDSHALNFKVKRLPEYTFESDTVDALSISAARGKDNQLYLALINIDPKLAHTVKVSLKDGALKAAKGRVLSAKAMDAENTFERPDLVVPKAFTAAVLGGELELQVPAKSMMVLLLEE